MVQYIGREAPCLSTAEVRNFCAGVDSYTFGGGANCANMRAQSLEGKIDEQ